MRRAIDGEAGQASVELAVLGPVLLVIALALAQVVCAGAAAELADHAAEAGAIALLQEADAAAAASDAVPGWSRGRMRVRVDGRRVRVTLRPRALLPGLGDVLEATGEADAGPAPERR